MISQYNQLHTSWVASSTDQKLTGSQRLTYRSESSEPHIKPSGVGIWHWKKEPLEHLALKASGACAQELHRTGGNGDPILKRRTWTFTCTRSQGKAKAPEESGSNPTAVLGGPPGKTGGECGLLWGKDIESKALGNIQQCAFLWRWPFWENLVPPVSQCWEAPGQTTTQVGSQPRPSVNRLPKDPSGTQLPLIPSRD